MGIVILIIVGIMVYGKETRIAGIVIGLLWLGMYLLCANGITCFFWLSDPYTGIYYQ